MTSRCEGKGYPGCDSCLNREQAPEECDTCDDEDNYVPDEDVDFDEDTYEELSITELADLIGNN